MPTVLTRVARAEQVAREQSKFSAECICFPENEPPLLAFDIEFEIAGAVKCPLHGERFKLPQLRVYMAKWMREKRDRLLWSRHSEQYRKAWFASFPETLWPAEEWEDEDGNTFLILRDGTRLFAMETLRPKNRSGAQGSCQNGLLPEVADLKGASHGRRR
jgi:hypothetical protein